MQKPLRKAMMAFIAVILICVARTPIISAAQSAQTRGANSIANTNIQEDGLSIVSSVTPPAMVVPGEAHVQLTLTNYSGIRMEDMRIVRGDSTVAAIVEALEAEGAPSYEFTEAVRLTAEQLDLGGLTYRIVYTTYDEQGQPVQREEEAMVSIVKKKAEPKIEFTRTLSSDHVQKGEDVTILYRIRNTGNVTLTDISMVDELAGFVDTLDRLEPGRKHTFLNKVKINQTSVSRPSLSYTYEGNEEGVLESLKPATIYLANEQLDLVLESDKNAVFPGDVVTLRLTLTNNGNVTYDNLRISERLLGELGEIPVKLKPGKSYTFLKTMTLKATATFQFDVSGKAGNGTEVEESSNMLAIEVSPMVENIVVALSVSAEPSRLSAPGPVNFLIKIENKSGLDIRNAILSEQTRGELKNLAVLAPGVTLIEQIYDVSATSTYVFLVELTDAQGGRLVVPTPIMVEVDETIDPSTTQWQEPSTTEIPRLGGVSYQLDRTTAFERMMLSVTLLLGSMVLVMVVAFVRKRKRVKRKEMLRQRRLKRLKRDEKPPREQLEQTRTHAPVKAVPEKREVKRKSSRRDQRRS